jgi:hypothetical protein
MQIARGNRLLGYFALASVTGSGLIAAAKTPAPVKAVTYRVRVSTQMPNFGRGGGGGGGGGNTDPGQPPAGGGGGGGFPGGFGGGGTQLVRVAVAGDRAKVEFQVGNPPGSSLTDFYLMLLDSNKTYRVSPDNQTYSDAELAPNTRGRGGRGGGGGGFGGGGAAGGRGNRGARGGDNNNNGDNGRGGRGAGGFVNPMQTLIDAVVTDMKATTEDLGAGETMDSLPTRHYKITVEYGFKLYGQPKQTKTTTEIWTVDFKGRVVNPFESTTPAPDDSTVAQVANRIVQEAKKIPGVPVKVVTTQVIPISAVGEAEAEVSASGVVAQTVNIVRTTLITALKEESVDDADLKIPADYKKVQGFGRGGGF